MKRLLIIITTLVLCFSINQTAFAKGYDFFPRLSINASNNGAKRLIDNYVYIGTAFGKSSSGGLIGPSIKYGFGNTGNKINVSWFMGNGFFSTELGISYFQQDSNSTLLISPDGKGYALEGSIRFGILIMNAIAAKGVTSLEFGLGF